MLPPFIIEQIRRREEEAERKQYEQPQLELPVTLTDFVRGLRSRIITDQKKNEVTLKYRTSDIVSGKVSCRIPNTKVYKLPCEL